MALPRSRTFWLSRFLSCNGWECAHEQARHLRGLDDIKAWLALPGWGTAETAAAPFWRTLYRLRPDCRVVVVRRPVGEVLDSMDRSGVAFDMAVLAKVLRGLDAKLDQIAARWPGCLSVRFADLADEATCARVFEHCLPFRHDPAWWRALAPLNLQCNLPALMRYMQVSLPALAKLAAQLKQQTLTAMRARPIVEPAGMTFQVEPFRSFYDGAQHLFRDHLVAVGEHPDNAPGKNIRLMQTLDDLGWMQCMTARSNGRVFGYLMTILAPSLEDETVLTAIHTTFYGSPDVPGLGMKLQRAALAALKERGVDELYFRAGPRGSGPRMGALYKRLGAAEDGILYRLDVERE